MSTATTELEPLQTGNLLDRDRHLDLEMDNPPVPPPVVMPPRSRQAVSERVANVPPPPHSRARARLLAIADGYLRSESLHQAMEMYFDLMAGYPETPEAELAEERVLEVASRHEQVGEMRMARAIYERLV
jgi:hypothetical protein